MLISSLLKKTLGVALFTSFAFTSSVSFAEDTKILRVGAEPSYAPFEFMDENTKQLTGFDIELIDAIAKAQGYSIEITTMPFDGLIPALFTNTIDVALSAITITPERQKRVAFSDPYYESGLSILIREEDQDKIKSVFDMHAGSTGKFTDFFLAQNIWDEIMAKHLADYRKANPDTSIVVICGNGHAGKYSGIPLNIENILRICFKSFSFFCFIRKYPSIYKLLFIRYLIFSIIDRK